MSANIVNFPERGDDADLIEARTGIALIDADAAVLARRWAEKSWQDRARLLSNFICESTKCWVVIVEGLEDDQDDRGNHRRQDDRFPNPRRRVGGGSDRGSRVFGGLRVDLLGRHVQGDWVILAGRQRRDPVRRRAVP